MQIKRALEEHGQHLGSAARLLGTSRHHLRQPVAVVVVQLLNAFIQAGERLAVGGQGQRVFIQRLEFINGVKKLLQRVALRLLVVNAHIGRDARQHHVAANEQFVGLAVQRDVFRRVPKTADTAPLPRANGERVAVLHAPVLAGNRGHQLGKVIGPALDLLHRGGVVQPMLGKKGGGRVAPKTGRAVGANARHAVVGGADPEPCVPALAQPVGQANVVGVHVRYHHAQNGQAFERIGKHLLPLLLGRVGADTAVHHRPARHAVDLVAQQPQVDVVEHKGQAHAYPFDAWGHRKRAAGRRHVLTQGVVQPFFKFVQGNS